jgi:hypothetical protein
MGFFCFTKEKLMRIKHLIRHAANRAKPVPLWKWAMIIFLVIAMPMYFLMGRETQLQGAIAVSAPEQDKNNK